MVFLGSSASKGILSRGARALHRNGSAQVVSRMSKMNGARFAGVESEKRSEVESMEPGNTIPVFPDLPGLPNKLCRTGVSRECGKGNRCPKWGTETDATDKTDWGGEVQDTCKSHERRCADRVSKMKVTGVQNGKNVTGDW